MLAVAGQGNGGEIDGIDQDAAFLRLGEGGDEADGGGLAGAGGADKGRDRAGFGDEGEVLQDGLAFFVGEVDMVEFDAAVNGRHGVGAGGVLVLALFVEDLLHAFQADERFGELAADGDDAEDRRDEEGEERGEGDELAEGEVAGEDFAGTDPHDEGADEPH